MNKTMKIFSSIVFALILITVGAFAQTAALLPNATQQFFDNNGNPLSSGTVTTYIVGTSTLKTTWKDAAETIPNTNPIVLDAGGKAIIFGDGNYRQVLKDRNGNLIWDAPTSAFGTSGATLSGDGTSVGTILQWSGLVAPTRYVFTYGQELSRTTYASLYSAITLNTNVNCTITSNILTGISDTNQIPIGLPVEASCLAGGTTVTAKSASTVTVSNNATVTVATTATFFPFGNGNGSTTFNVPDLRGKILAGRNNLGGTSAATLTTTYYGTNPNALGAVGGNQSVTLGTTNLPAYTPAGTIVSTQVAHSHFIANGDNGNNPTALLSTSSLMSGGTTGVSYSGVAAFGYLLGGTATTPTVGLTSSVTPAITSTFTGTAQGGAATAFSLVQPSITMNYIIKVTPDTNISTLSVVTSLGGMVGDITCGSGVTCTSQTISVSSGGTPGGSNTQCQYNNSSVFGGVTGCTTDGTTITLVAPVLGTPASINLTNATALPVGAITGLGTGVGTWLVTPSGANLASALTSALPVSKGGTGLTSGTSGGLPTFTASGTITSSGALTANLPVIGGGAGAVVSVGTRSGNTTAYVTTTGAQTSGNCVSIDANGNHIATGTSCGGGSGSVTSVATTSPITGGTITTTGTIACATCVTSAAALTSNAIVIGGGLQATSTTTTGTGVLTALGVNTGSAGAFVVNGGALGTPSSGTLTNATGLPIGGVTGLGTGIATWLATPSGANLTSALTSPLTVAGGGTGAATLGSGLPLFGAGTSAITTGTLSGNTTKLATTTGTLTSGNCVQIDASGNFVQTGVPCGGAGAGITALTGDVTAAGSGSVAATLANIPTATPMAGSLLVTNITAPGTPAAGKTSIYVDSTSKRLSSKNDAGTIAIDVVPDTGASNNFLTAISTSGVISKAQPAFSNLSGSATCAQLPALTGDTTTSAGSCTTTLATGNAGNLNSGTLLAARMPALTGDITTSVGAIATTLATVNSNVGTFGSATQVSQVTVNAKGLTTAASNVTITPDISNITGLGTGIATWLGTPSGANLAAALTSGLGVAGGGTGNVTATSHSIPINQGTAAQSNTGAGTTGQALISQGASADPIYASGTWVLLNTLTASNSATLSDTTSFTSTYNEYELIFENVLPATNAVVISIKVHSGGTFQTTSYVGALITQTSAGGTPGGASSTSNITLTSNTTSNVAANGGTSGRIVVFTPSGTASPKAWIGQFNNGTGSGTSQTTIVSSQWNSTAAVDGFNVSASSGNLTSGVVKVYGRL